MADTNRNITPITELSEEQLFTVQKVKDKIYYITDRQPVLPVIYAGSGDERKKESEG